MIFYTLNKSFVNLHVFLPGILLGISCLSTGMQLPGLDLLGFMEYWDPLTLRVCGSFSVCRGIAFINEEKCRVCKLHLLYLITATRTLNKTPSQEAGL